MVPDTSGRHDMRCGNEERNARSSDGYGKGSALDVTASHSGGHEALNK